MSEPQAVRIVPESKFSQFFRDVLDCLTEPKKFFEEKYPKRTMTDALLFAVIVSWVANLIEWLIRTVKNETLFDGMMLIRKQLEALPIWKNITPHLFSDQSSISPFPSWIMEFSIVALSPFKTLIAVTLTALMIWLSSTFLIPKNDSVNRDPVDFSSFIKLLAYASIAPKLVGAILGFLPLQLGALVGGICVLLLQIFAISNRYAVSRLRSFAIIILPSFVFIMIASCLVIGFFAIFMGLMGGMMGGI